MSDALRKNETALAQIVGNETLAHRLQSVRIGIWSEEGHIGVSGLLLSEALGDVLGRFWQNVDVHGSVSSTFTKAFKNASQSGGQVCHVGNEWNPPYDFVISVATKIPHDAGKGINVGGAGWIAKIGPDAFTRDDKNPVGPAVAAAIAAMEAFKMIFSNELGEQILPQPHDYEWNIGNYGQNFSPPQIAPLHFDNVHVVGVGAVTHGLLWLLERWPCDVTGTIHLIDQDHYDQSNGQRYIGMKPEDIGCSKPEQAAGRLRSRYPNLKVFDHKVDMNRYFAERNPECLVGLTVVGVDSAEHRRQMALKLPRRMVNMWTEKNKLGTARFGFTDGWACPICCYPENITEPLDETGQISSETGLKPARVRELLFSGAGLTASDIDVIILKYPNLSQHNIIGKPLRSVRGVLCATGQIRLQGESVDVDVPFAFSSFLSGIFGFMELAHEIWGSFSEPGHWQMSVFGYPVPGHWWNRSPNPDCYLCSDELVHQIIKQKYL